MISHENLKGVFLVNLNLEEIIREITREITSGFRNKSQV